MTVEQLAEGVRLCSAYANARQGDDETTKAAMWREWDAWATDNGAEVGSRLRDLIIMASVYIS